MGWLNGFGALFMCLLLAPNVAFAMTHRDGFENRVQNRTLETLEQIGRFGSFLLMIACPPFLSGGWLFAGAETAYRIAGAALVGLYLIGWIIFWNENSMRKSLALSILPSALFLESGILSLNYPLIAAAVIFAPCHIAISALNAEKA